MDMAWMTTPWRRWSKSSLLRAWTTVINAVLAGSPKSTLHNWQTLNYNVCWMQQLVSSQTLTSIYDRGLSSLLLDQLHWLDVDPERVEYKLIAVVVRRCLENKAPKYLSVHCTPVTAVSSRHLRYTNTISQPSSADCTALSADYIRPSGFLYGRPDGLEVTTDWASWPVCQFWGL